MKQKIKEKRNIIIATIVAIILIVLLILMQSCETQKEPEVDSSTDSTTEFVEEEKSESTDEEVNEVEDETKGSDENDLYGNNSSLGQNSDLYGNNGSLNQNTDLNLEEENANSDISESQEQNQEEEKEEPEETQNEEEPKEEPQEETVVSEGDPEEVVIQLESISLNKTKLTLKKGEKFTLKVIFKPENATGNRDVTWVSKDEKVAKVKSDGTVVAKASGKTEIVAICNGKKARCTVVVKKSGDSTQEDTSSETTAQESAGSAQSDTQKAEDTKYPLQSISLNQSQANLVVGGSTGLTVTYNPSNTTDSKNVTWSTSNGNVVTVSNGNVTAVGPGSAVITASCNGKTATCNFTVTSPLQGISLNATSLNLEIGDGANLVVNYNPSNTTDSKNVAWSSSNTAVATVDANGNVFAEGDGSAIITANCNGKTATCSITVGSSSGSGGGSGGSGSDPGNGGNIYDGTHNP